MRVSIWDMDFYHKKTFLPSPVAMKISSFHKQQHHIVNFIEESYHIDMSYDLFYIIKEREETPRPHGKFYDNKKVKMIGRSFRFADNHWEIDSIIASVRPDYDLYPEIEKNAYYNANIAQFFHNGKKIKIKQPFENTKKHHKKTLIIDKDFWDADENDIILCLEELLEYGNIAFLHPINLMRIMKSKTIQNLFIKLNFTRPTTFKFRNNYSQEYEGALELFEFIRNLKYFNSSVKISNLPFKAITEDHWLGGLAAGFRDFERCLKIINEAKRQKIHIRIVSPRKRMDSPYWYYFEFLEYWTLYLENKSYIEAMLFSAEKRYNLVWFEILNNPIKWSTPNTNFLLSLMNRKKEWIDLYFYRQWGDSLLDKYLIDWDQVKKYLGKIEDDFEENKDEII